MAHGLGNIIDFSKMNTGSGESSVDPATFNAQPKADLSLDPLSTSWKTPRAAPISLLSLEPSTVGPPLVAIDQKQDPKCLPIVEDVDPFSSTTLTPSITVGQETLFMEDSHLAQHFSIKRANQEDNGRQP